MLDIMQRVCAAAPDLARHMGFLHSLSNGGVNQQAPTYRGTIGIFSRNMLFLDHVGQNVRANLPKLRRHLPPTGRDLQILQIQFFWLERLLSERAGITKKRSADCTHRARYPNGSRINCDEYSALLICSSTSRGTSVGLGFLEG